VINPEEFRLPQSRLQNVKTRVPRHRKGERFLRGPIPWYWLQLAMRLPGKAFHVGIGLWFLAGLEKSGRVTCSASRLGLPRKTASRGLVALETAGLVKVERAAGRSPRVTILEPGPLDPERPGPGVGVQAPGARSGGWGGCPMTHGGTPWGLAWPTARCGAPPKAPAPAHFSASAQPALDQPRRLMRRSDSSSQPVR